MNYLQNYDAGGNLTFSVDPDKGITYYTYDANLNVLSDVVLYTYDSLNRMVSKNCGNGTTINIFMTKVELQPMLLAD